VTRDQRIAAKVRGAMAELRLSQTQTAAIVYGRSQQWFWDRLAGRVAFSAGELFDLAEYLGVDVNEWIQASREELHKAS
jgi:hypothetical protein